MHPIASPRRMLFFPDKSIKRPSHQTISCILLADHNFTTNTSSSLLTTTMSYLPDNNPCVYAHCTFYDKYFYSRGPAKSKNSYCNPVNSPSIRTPTQKILNGILPVVISFVISLPLSCNTTISHTNRSPPSKFETYS